MIVAAQCECVGNISCIATNHYLIQKVELSADGGGEDCGRQLFGAFTIVPIGQLFRGDGGIIQLVEYVVEGSVGISMEETRHLVVDLLHGTTKGARAEVVVNPVANNDL